MIDRFVLPARGAASEDAFIAVWSEATDTDGLVELTGAAIQARRPLLAGRLFQLVDERIEIRPGSDLDRAARAARMFLVNKSRPEDHSWSALDDAWTAARRGRVRRMKQRQRDRLNGRQRTIRRHERKRR